MKKIIALAACASLLAACDESEIKRSGNGGGGSGGGNREEQAIDETDLSACQSGPLATDLRGRWRTRTRSGEFHIVTDYSFNGGYLTIDNTCYFRGYRLAARVSSPYADNGSQLTVHSNDERTERLDEGGVRMSCNAAVRAMTMRYSRQGSCIRLHDPAGRAPDMVLAPL